MALSQSLQQRILQKLSPRQIQLMKLLLVSAANLQEDMPDKFIFIQCYDEIKKELQRIVDMPDKDISLMILFLHQNKGVFPIRRREQFPKLTWEKIQRMQEAYRMVYEIDDI